MSQPIKGPKTMSSQLLSMKFMQRAAASKSSPPTTPSEPSAKRQRLSNGSFNSIPSSTPRTDGQASPDVPSPEEQRRNEALELQAASRGDTKWYLSIREAQSPVVNTPLRIVSAGYATLDGAGSATDHLNEEDEPLMDTPQAQGRRSFGKFNAKLEKQQNPHLSPAESSSGSSESEDDEEGGKDDSDDPTGAKAMIANSRKEAGDKARAERATRKGTSKAEAVRLEAERLAAERRKKYVKLNKTDSISGTGGPNSSRKTPLTHMTCHRCGEKGHMKKDCHIHSKSFGSNAS